MIAFLKRCLNVWSFGTLRRGERLSVYVLFSTFLLFPIECFIYKLLPFPSVKLEVLGQILESLRMTFTADGKRQR